MWVGRKLQVGRHTTCALALGSSPLASRARAPHWQVGKPHVHLHGLGSAGQAGRKMGVGGDHGFDSPFRNESHNSLIVSFPSQSKYWSLAFSLKLWAFRLLLVRQCFSSLWTKTLVVEIYFLFLKLQRWLTDWWQKWEKLMHIFRCGKITRFSKHGLRFSFSNSSPLWNRSLKVIRGWWKTTCFQISVWISAFQCFN